jgi:hypothetical protein
VEEEGAEEQVSHRLKQEEEEEAVDVLIQNTRMQCDEY